MNEHIKKESSDYELIKAFQKGMSDQFDLLVLRYQNRIFNLCYRFMGNMKDAEDCVQEIFIKVYRHLDTFRCESSFATWLYKIAMNTCKNKYSSFSHRIKRMIRSIDDPPAFDDKTYSLQLADKKQSTRTMLDIKEKSELLQKALDTLTEKKRMILVLHDIEGVPYKEIMSITGLKMGTVKSMLFRARQDMAEKIKGILSDEL